MSAAETYNIPLEEMNVSDLECLRHSISEILESRELEVKADAIKKLKASGKLKEYKDELKGLKAEAKAFAAKKIYNLTIPVTFTVSGQVYEKFFDEISEYGDAYWSDMVSLGVKGKVGEGFNKAQTKLLQGALDELLDDACEDFMLLFPDLLIQRENLEKRAAKFVTELEKHDIDIGEL